jgi:hypothetical protein
LNPKKEVGNETGAICQCLRVFQNPNKNELYTRPPTEKGAELAIARLPGSRA